jgi:hypothetical protein
MRHMGWTRGQRLGPSSPTTQEAVRSDRAPWEFSASSHFEMWSTLAGTLASKHMDMHERVKRSHDGTLAPVLFTSGPVEESTAVPVSWHELSNALVAMTEYAFSESGVVYVLESPSGDAVQEKFHWGPVHVRLSNPSSLPSELQRGMKLASNAAKWISTMELLLAHRTYYWQWDAQWSREYLQHVGSLWKTLEVAINHAELSLDFCVFFCSQVMVALLTRADCGSMTFVPILKSALSASSSSAATAHPQGFQARVRYRAEGLKPEQRYRKATRTQSRGIWLLRPFLAAQGALPAATASSRRQQH